MSSSPAAGPEEAATVIVEGRWAVEALLDCPWIVTQRIFVESGRHAEIADRAHDEGIEVEEASREQLAVARGYEFHRGVYAEADRPEPCRADEAVLRAKSSVVIPHGLSDPGNLGTVIRSAAAFGAGAICLPQGLGADAFNPKCIRASATAVFRIPLLQYCDPGRLLKELGSAGYVRFATVIGSDSRPLDAVSRGSRNAIFLGAEADGLPASITGGCDERVHIPMASGMDSLNVGATAAVVLREILGRPSS